MKVKNIIIIAIIFAGGLFVKDYFDSKREEKRQTSNNENLLRELRGLKDSIDDDLIQYQVKNKEELKNYLDANNNQLIGLEDKLSKVDLKLRKITRIVSTTVNTRDTIINKINLDSIAHYLSRLKPFKTPFEDKTDCFYIRGEFEFDGELYSINLLEREYTDTITHVSSWERKKTRWLFGIKSGLFGKKVGKITLLNNCGESKTIIIDK